MLVLAIVLHMTVADDEPSSMAWFEKKPPFAAWSAKPAAHIKKMPRADALDIGLVRRGDWVVVKACEPDCVSPTAWALLEPFGALRMNDLRSVPQETDEALSQATFQRFLYGTVLPRRINVYESPNPEARVIRRHPAKHVLAFREEQVVPGWLQRPSKGWVRAEDVRVAKPSELRGVENPEGDIAFFIREFNGITRHATRTIVSTNRWWVKVTPGGDIPRDYVRIAKRHTPPPHVQPGQKWVHVDLKEQVLTAYDGDDWVYATLISSGKGRNKTMPGVFRVQMKVAHTSMDSERDRYYVDEVPYIQYFNGGQGFHAAFWHDRFGQTASHGCVNLSVDDSRWLFDWTTPRLPEGWQSIISHNANLASTWVHVQ